VHRAIISNNDGKPRLSIAAAWRRSKMQTRQQRLRVAVAFAANQSGRPLEAGR
jgi:hypothetical protein